MKVIDERTSVPVHVYGPETHITAIILTALGIIPAAKCVETEAARPNLARSASGNITTSPTKPVKESTSLLLLGEKNASPEIVSNVVENEVQDQS